MRTVRGVAWTWPGAAYVVLVAAVAGVAQADPHDVRPVVWVAALLGALPATVVLVPGLYLVIPLIWQLSSFDNGGPTWPTTAGYVACFAAAAVSNLVVLHAVRSARAARRSRSAGAVVR